MPPAQRAETWSYPWGILVRNPEDYSLSKFVRETKLTAGHVGAKSVILPSRVQTVRPHAPGGLHDGYQMAKVAKQLNVMVHFRKWRAVTPCLWQSFQRIIFIKPSAVSGRPRLRLPKRGKREPQGFVIDTF